MKFKFKLRGRNYVILYVRSFIPSNVIQSTVLLLLFIPDRYKKLWLYLFQYHDMVMDIYEN